MPVLREENQQRSLFFQKRTYGNGFYGLKNTPNELLKIGAKYCGQTKVNFAFLDME